MVDALYLNLSNEEPDGVIEITEGVNIDTTDDGRLTGIEILKASNKMNLDTILSYTLDLDQNTLEEDCLTHGKTGTLYPIALMLAR